MRTKYLNYVVNSCVKLSYTFFLKEVVGLPNENQSCILNILATKRLELKSIPFLTFCFSICDRSQAFPIFTKIRDLFYCNYAYAAYLTYVSHIYNLNSLFRQQLKICCVITCLHLLVVALATCVLR